MLPTVSPELAQRFEQVWASDRAARMRGLTDLPGNPLGARVASFGKATACRTAGLPDERWVNVTANLSAADLDQVDALLEYYREANATGWIDVTPATGSPDLLRALAAKGAYQAGFHCVTYGLPNLDQPAPPPGVTIDRIERAEVPLFLEVNQRGFGAPPPHAPQDYWYDLPGWHLYLARVDGIPAGAATLIVEDGVGYMASGCTLPEMRGRGVQRALLARRMADAARTGCDILFGQCDFGSISHRNQEACGLRTAYTKAIWRTR